MDSVDVVRGLLHLVAGALLWPVLVALLLLSASMVIAIGAFLREAVQRHMDAEIALRGSLQNMQRVVGERDEREALDLRMERLLQDDERLRWRSLARLRLAVRLGPALGLMGTLIPMATALQGLASGELPALASNMVTAFAATVVGLAVSVIAYLLAAARESWVRTDTQALAFHAERLLRSATS